jgi:hypothetical protein
MPPACPATEKLEEMGSRDGGEVQRPAQVGRGDMSAKPTLVLDANNILVRAVLGRRVREDHHRPRP